MVLSECGRGDAAQTGVGDCNGDNTVGINELILGGLVLSQFHIRTTKGFPEVDRQPADM